MRSNFPLTTSRMALPLWQTCTSYAMTLPVQLPWQMRSQLGAKIWYLKPHAQLCGCYGLPSGCVTFCAKPPSG